MKPVDITMSITAALAIGFIAGVSLPCKKPDTSPIRQPMPRALAEYPFAYPLGNCDARVIQSVGHVVTRDGCWTRKAPQVWL